MNALTRRVFIRPLSYFTFYTPPIHSPTMSSPALPRSENSPTPTRETLDPLAFNYVRGLAGTPAGARDRNGSEAEEDNGDEVVRRPRRGPTGVNLDDIPRVKDDTGDKVMDSFVLFLEKLVISWVDKEEADEVDIRTRLIYLLHLPLLMRMSRWLLAKVDDTMSNRSARCRSSNIRYFTSISVICSRGRKS